MHFLSHFTTACKIMRLSILQQLIAIFLMASAHARETSAQDLLKTNITIRAENVSLLKVMSMIEQQVNVRFAYSRSMVQIKQDISVRAEKQPLGLVLNNLFSETGIDYQVVKDQIILKKKQSTSRFDSEGNTSVTTDLMEKTITGQVTDPKGEALPGVSILL
jgi:hypothetical protein